ncbi:MAG TPA: M23 family metallopeptidase [Steroidobacteraceae bacterium]|nr:M23 family metallopeptidase [Steroidobacteraceae bacterium]
MNIIIFSRQHGHARQFDLRSPVFIGASVGIVLLLFGGVFAAGSWVGAQWADSQPARQFAHWSAELGKQREQIEAARALVHQNVDALAMRVGQMNAHVIRLDALGKRLTAMAKLNKGEFDFDRAPPVGGVDETAGSGLPASAPLLTDMLDRLSDQVADRERQLGALENVILTRELRRDVYPQGRPVLAGFISSFFGQRLDPFTGYTAFHAGIDFAGEAGAQVVSVATGVVTWAGERVGYGNLVEVNHGNGYLTRYAHNSVLLVKAGDTVQKGQVLSLMGSTGHSTGPHLHFEVLKDGSPVDPMAFINENAAPLLKSGR